jgi:Flp pilus assembly protein TadG
LQAGAGARQWNDRDNVHACGRAEPREVGVAGRNQTVWMRVKTGEGGQAVMLSVVWMVVLLGMAGFVIDVGTWFRAQRNLQSQADAAALAGAQELPDTVPVATGLAQQYAVKNGITVPLGDITISGVTVPNDSITVKVKKASPSFFSKLFGISSVTVHAQATAKSSLLGSAQYVAPIAVNILHPLLSGPACPNVCFNQTTTLPLGKTGAPGAFALVDLDDKGGTGASDIANWIMKGFPDALNLGDYFSNTGAKWDNNSIDAALTARIGTVLMFPVYDVLVGTGVNATYHVVAWVGFRVDSFTATGTSGSITGQFTRIDWQGLPAPTPSSEPNLGAKIVTLTG